MRTKCRLNLMSLLWMLFVVTFTTSCNKDDGEKISAEQIRQALFDMKGSYNGTLLSSLFIILIRFVNNSA
ncbi:MAG: hypothetical protein RSA75_09835, partial [Bacteroidales bacterium]